MAGDVAVAARLYGMTESLAPELPSTPLEAAYRKFDTDLRVRNVKACCVLALVLVPACVALDYYTYPQLLWPLIKMRILHDLLLLPLTVILCMPLGRRQIKILGYAPTMLPALAICWMIYASEGAVSPYYAGLNLIFTGTILLIPYSRGEAVACCVMVMALYALACLLHAWLPPSTRIRSSTGVHYSALATNLVFLIATAVIAITACHYNAIRRFEDFSLRHELHDNNVELASTLKKLQDTEVQLVQSEKMNALGKLSAGLLHEINNPLNYTFMALQVAQGEAGDNESLNETLNDIHQGMERIRGVISDLRAFAHPTPAEMRETFDLGEALTTALRLTAHELGTIPVDQSAISGCVAVGAKTQIVHVFMNLLVNSAYALRQVMDQREPRIVISSNLNASRLEISVQDNGCGVADADLPRLTEPFFTTKQPGEGTGLGLSICHTIIENHGGKIAIASEKGSWTKVTFDLGAAAVVREAA